MSPYYQDHWYRFVAERFAAGRSVLDVGTGAGTGLRHFREAGACRVDGFDLVPVEPALPVGRVEDYPDASYDLVTAMDVIEHVADDHCFLDHLLRVAGESVFFSTPNWNVSRARNSYHVREYTPTELLELIKGKSRDWHLWVSDGKQIVQRAWFDPAETWPQFGVLLGKV